MTDHTPLLIVGTGAMASLFASRMVAAGIDVNMLGSWPEGLHALQEHGVTVVEADGSERVYPVRATSDPGQLGSFQNALVLVKAWQNQRAGCQLAECLQRDGLALTLQNGLGNRELLSKAIGPQRTASGVTTSGATLLGPGRVRPVGNGQVSLGAHPRLEPMADLLQTAGFKVDVLADTTSLIWGKLVINAAINPLTALLRIPNGELLNRPNARALMAAAAREAAAVAGASQISLPYPDPVSAVEDVARRTAGNLSSMLQDVQRGTPTEIDAICGAIVKAGARVKVPTPVIRTMWLLVRAIEGR
jgi:2-dehydropantoate 2-reductase